MTSLHGSKIVVVVPAPNASKNGRIYPLMNSLLAQSITPHAVVLVGISQDEWSKHVEKYPFLVPIAFDRPADHVGRDTNCRRSLGLNKALELGADYVLFTDVKMSFSDSSTIERAIKIMTENDKHVLCGMIHSEHNWREAGWSWLKFIQGYSDAALVKKLPEFPKLKIVDWDNSGDSESFVVTGCLMLDRHAAEILHEVGGPPKDYTISYEDYATGMRLLNANLSILVTSQVYGEHEHRSSLNGIITEHLRSGWAAAQLYTENPTFGYAKRRWKQAVVLPLLMATWGMLALLFSTYLLLTTILGLTLLCTANSVKHRHVFAFAYPLINIFAILCFLFGFWDYKLRDIFKADVPKKHIEKFYFQC